MKIPILPVNNYKKYGFQSANVFSYDIGNSQIK